MGFTEGKRRPGALNLAPARTPSVDSTSSSDSSLKAPRTPRFAEATTVYSPVDKKVSPFSSTKDRSVTVQAQPADVGFGYINEKRESVAMPMTPRSPLKSAMRVPGTPGRALQNPLSPTFQEEEMLEKREAHTDKEQARDLKIKTRVRMAKFALRGVNFSCSLIVMSMMSTTFAIFNATKSLPAQNNLPPWANNTSAWPQKVVLAAACVSLVVTVGVLAAYCRGGHRRAEKVGVYYTIFAVVWFILSMIMWAFAAGILQYQRNNSGNQDIWGWSCVQNKRAEQFAQKVDYALVCRLQAWGMICAIIEVTVEVISIILYSIIFYRYYSKRKLHKTMDMRDKARSDLYLAQLRTQSAPNTPGFGPKSPGYAAALRSPGLGPKSPAFSQYAMSPRFPPQAYKNLGDVDETASPFTPGGKRLVEPESSFAARMQQNNSPKPSFKLQAPPVKAPSATPRMGGGKFSPVTATRTPSPPAAAGVPSITVNEHMGVAPGEQQYDAVPIPGAYADQAVKSPPPQQTTFGASYQRSPTAVAYNDAEFM